MLKRLIISSLVACVSVVAGAQGQTEKYLFDGAFPVFLDSLQSELTYPMAWGSSDIKEFGLWRSAARNKLRGDAYASTSGGAQRHEGGGYRETEGLHCA